MFNPLAPQDLRKEPRFCGCSREAAMSLDCVQTQVETQVDYTVFCPRQTSWGVGLQVLAVIGIVVTVILLAVLLVLMRRVRDCGRRSVLATQVLFLLGLLGLFGLTFAFLLCLDRCTGPTRFFLFGVLFAICFSCLLAHTLHLARLARGCCPFSWLQLLGIAVGFSLVQIIIATEYVTLTLTRGVVLAEMAPEALCLDFVLLLVYVLFLMALVLLASVAAAFCGPCSGWKRQGLHICVTIIFSIAIWASWISLLLRTPGRPWDNPVIAIALVVNAWVFLLTYMVPEICFLCSSCRAPAGGRPCPGPPFGLKTEVCTQELTQDRGVRI
ncbi:G-protein coupled receptor family C group 5 member D-like isoform X2 [Tachyglossus aculeatus]|uniref:G-protein coupled receptor family C group 5 member D-like isoform X2 n=1 Tax=Tachyglossus aculeatus TaxID=9261 RepID=UPI0018F28695|nr:G-protein coupled receptor family C group 5 member D-like isoform X2 [Tachyglossus aculeatus]